MIETAIVQAHPDRHFPSAREIVEASVHRPHRGKLYVASYRDETGRQRWQRTGLSSRKAALILAKEWENAVRQKRGLVPKQQKKALIRVRAKGSEGLFTQKETAALLRISERACRDLERRAINKLKNHPLLRALWREWTEREIEEGSVPATRWELSRSEIVALYGLARTHAERELLRKLMAWIGAA